MTMHTRLRRLERTTVGPSCPACRDRRGSSVLVTPCDRTEAPAGDWPAPCSRCGEVPEQVIEIVTEVVETHEQATAQKGTCGG